ncbi:MAG TPA: BatD family protein [bacterium]|nr:BatD family protein [bacterium]
MLGLSLASRTRAFAFTMAILAALCASAFAGGASIEASVDRASVFIDDEITLIVAAQGIDGEPDLPDISDDFSIVSQSQSRSMTIINMQIESSTTYRYVLQPERVGVLKIPPIRAKAGSRTIRTKPIQIEVLGRQAKPRQRTQPTQPWARNRGAAFEPEQETTADQDIFIETSVDKTTVFLGEQVTLKFKLFTRFNLASADYTPPPCTNFWKEDIQGKKSYTAVVRGRRYRVEEITTALFPTNTGVQTIGPGSLICSVDTFFSPTFSFRNLDRQRPRHLKTKPIDITVKALPNGAPATFHGAVGQFSLSSTIDKRSVQLGKPVTLRIRIWGTGNVKTIQQVPKPELENFDIYEPNVKETVDNKKSTISGSKSFEFVMVARKPGSHTIPPAEFSFFDLQSSKYKTLKTQPIKVEVTGSLSKTPATPLGGLLKRTDVRQTGADIDYIKPKMTRFEDFRQDLYKRTSALLVILLPAVLLLVLCAKDVVVEKVLGDTKVRGAWKKAVRGLARAKSHMDSDAPQEFYSQLAKSLIDYVADKFDVPAPGISAMTVGAIIGDSNAGKHAAKLASECMEVCDFYRFSAQKSSTQEMQDVLSRVEETLSILHRAAPKKETEQRSQ